MDKDYITIPQQKQTIEALWRLLKIILETLDYEKVVQRIVDSLLDELGYLKLGYRIVVLTLVDEEKKVLKRISLSQTEEAERALKASVIPFHQIEIPLNNNDNLLIKVLNGKKPQVTRFWPDMFIPALTEEQALNNQKAAGIHTSMVYPVILKDKAIGVMIFSMVKDEKAVSEAEVDLIRGFTDLVAIAVQNSRLYSRVKSAETNLLKTNEKLKELDAQKDEFISMAAHELRAPMTAIKGYVSMVTEGDTGDIPEKARGFLTDASNITDRLIRLVNNMLNVSRIEEGRIVYQEETEHLSSVIQSVFNQFVPEAQRKGLEFKLDIPSQVKDTVKVDPDRVQEVLGNLISNAIKYTDSGSVLVKLSQPNEKAILCEVIDTGPGVSEEEQQKLFQKFQRAESTIGKTTGTGLGLYISKLLVEKFGGKIGLKSKPGEGSTFWFELPLASASGAGDDKN